jgi:hypothetical protein
LRLLVTGTEGAQVMSQNKGWCQLHKLEINETLKQYGFTQEQLDLIVNNAYWSKPYDWEAKGMEAPYWIRVHRFVGGITLLPLPLSYEQDVWLRRIQRGINVCQYKSSFHKGKVEWHHPIEGNWAIGLWLCEAHHSILLGRKKKYPGEFDDGKTLEVIRVELNALEIEVVLNHGLDPVLINKR